MAYKQKDNSGALFKNDKGDNPSRPDYRGDALVNGELMEIAAWLKDGQRGKFMSLSFKVKSESPVQATSQPKRQERTHSSDDEIPF